MSDKPTGRAVIAGEIETVEPDGTHCKTKLGLLIAFDSIEAIRQALASGECVFSVFGREPPPPEKTTAGEKEQEARDVTR